MAKRKKIEKEIVKGSDGYYFDYVYDDDGKEHKVRGKTLQSLYKNMAKKEIELKEGIKVINKNTTVKQWSIEYVDTFKKPSIGAQYYKMFYSRLNNHIIPQVGFMKLKDVKLIHLQKMMNCLTGKSYSLVSSVYAITREIFKEARVNRLILIDPSEGLKMPSYYRNTHRAITDFERKCTLKLVETHFAGLWIEMLLYCGARPSETIPMQWRHVDFKNKVIHITNSVDAASDEIKDTKSPAGVREVPISDEYLKKLKKLKGDPCEYIFKRPTTGERHALHTLEWMWKKFKNELDVLLGAEVSKKGVVIKSVVADDLVPYCYRHTFGTDLQAAGVDINVAKELMGHEDIKVTSRIYTHKSKEATDRAAQKMNEYHKVKSLSCSNKGDGVSDENNGTNPLKLVH